MPANVHTYIGRQAAWHALGTVTGSYQTWADILAHGGLDFQVFKSQLHDGRGQLVRAWGTFRWNTADNLRETPPRRNSWARSARITRSFSILVDLSWWTS